MSGWVTIVGQLVMTITGVSVLATGVSTSIVVWKLSTAMWGAEGSATMGAFMRLLLRRLGYGFLGMVLMFLEIVLAITLLSLLDDTLKGYDSGTFPAAVMVVMLVTALAVAGLFCAMQLQQAYHAVKHRK